MRSNLLIIVNHLRSFMGDLAEEFLAMELLKIDKRYVEFERDYYSCYIALPAPEAMPTINPSDMKILLDNISDALRTIVGPTQSKNIMDRIEGAVGEINRESMTAMV